MQFKRIIQRGLTALGVAILGSCATVPQAAEARAIQPALWQVADADTKIYLFGTIHLLPRDTTWRTPKLEAALAGSQSLVIETIVDTANPTELAAHMRRLGVSRTVPPIANRVAPEKRALLEAAIAKTGVPRPFFDQLETWAAAFTLLGVQFKSIGVGADKGVETVLREAFAASGKPVGQLETNAEQLSFFDGLPESAQRALLEGAVEAPSELRTAFDSMLAAWQRGDVDAIARTFNADLAESPELRDALLSRRNANWANWVERRLAQPGSVMVAVGAGHLAGDGSVLQMLERDGYKVTRLQ